MSDIDLNNLRIAMTEALKYDERIWRAFQTLKTCHREGLLDALAAPLLTRLERAERQLAEAQRTIETGNEAFRVARDQWHAQLAEVRAEREALKAAWDEWRALDEAALVEARRTELHEVTTWLADNYGHSRFDTGGLFEVIDELNAHEHRAARGSKGE